jgi:hypothetical protein
MEEFALGIFANADKADRESPVQPPDISLAGRFYISSLFFDVLTQFHENGQLPPDLDEKRKYAKYRTLQIRNRKPLDSLEQPPAVVAVDVDSSSSRETKAPIVTVSPPKNPAVSSVPTTFKYADDSHGTTVETRYTITSPSVDATSAKKKLQQAVSAIEFGDLKTATTLASDAIRILEKHK